MVAPGAEELVVRLEVEHPILQETHQNGTWGYYFFAGTSMASPQVAATAAMLMSLGATSDEAKSLMIGTAIDLDKPSMPDGASVCPVVAFAATHTSGVPSDDPYSAFTSDPVSVGSPRPVPVP